jgi:hypothetical protein
MCGCSKVGGEAGKEAIFFVLRSKEEPWKQGTPPSIGKRDMVIILMRIRFCEELRSVPSEEAFCLSLETKSLKNAV